MRLFQAEWRRMVNRGLARWAMVALIGVIGIFGFAIFRSTTPPSAAEMARQQQLFEQNRAEWERNVTPSDIATCRAQEAEAQLREPNGKIEFGCDGPQLKDYTWNPTPLQEILNQGIPVVLMTAGLTALVVSASFVGAEFSSGAISMWLTFEPRRIRVFVSKLTATALAALLFGVTAYILVGLVSWLAVALHDGPTAFDPGFPTLYVGRVARMQLVVVGMGLLGAALGFLLRNMAAVIGLVVAYYVVVESILTNMVQGLARWRLGTNITALVDGRTSYFTQRCANDAKTGEYICQAVDSVVTWKQGSLVLAGLMIVAVGLAGYLFKRRDLQ